MTLLDFFPEDFVLFVDESHVTLPQVRAMYGGDYARKKTLVEYVWLATQGLRLRSRKLPKARQVPETEQGVGVPYPVAAREKRASKSEG